MKVEGGCHCGAIGYEAEIDPAAVVICHCTDCQALSGAPYRANVPVPAEKFRLLRGTPKTYLKSTADSGNKRHQAFCADCGSALYGAAPEPNPAVYMLRIGSLKQRAEIEPKKQIWSKSALDWITRTAGLDGHPGQPGHK